MKRRPSSGTSPGEASQAVPAQLRLNAKDITTLTLSALALLISATAAYFTYYGLFHEARDAQVRVVEFSIDFSGLLTQLVFVNRGNKPIVVFGAEGDLTLSGDPLLMSLTPMAPDGTFPFVLEKGQVKLVALRTPAELLEIPARTSRSDRIKYGLRIGTVDDAGERKGAEITCGDL